MWGAIIAGALAAGSAIAGAVSGGKKLGSNPRSFPSPVNTGSMLGSGGTAASTPLSAQPAFSSETPPINLPKLGASDEPGAARMSGSVDEPGIAPKPAGPSWWDQYGKQGVNILGAGMQGVGGIVSSLTAHPETKSEMAGGVRWDGAFSDVRAKQNIRGARGEARSLLDELAKAGPQQYDYRPDFGGQHAYGPMAQDLEQAGPMGRAMVGRDKSGMRYLKQPELEKGLLAALAEQQRQIQALEQRTGRWSDGTPKMNYDPRVGWVNVADPEAVSRAFPRRAAPAPRVPWDEQLPALPEDNMLPESRSMSRAVPIGYETPAPPSAFLLSRGRR